MRNELFFHGKAYKLFLLLLNYHVVSLYALLIYSLTYAYCVQSLKSDISMQITQSVTHKNKMKVMKINHSRYSRIKKGKKNCGGRIFY